MSDQSDQPPPQTDSELENGIFQCVISLVLHRISHLGEDPRVAAETVAGLLESYARGLQLQYLPNDTKE